MEADSLSGNATSMISQNTETPGFQVRSRAGGVVQGSPGQLPSRFLKSDDFYVNMKTSKTMKKSHWELERWLNGEKDFLLS